MGLKTERRAIVPGPKPRHLESAGADRGSASLSKIVLHVPVKALFSRAH